MYFTVHAAFVRIKLMNEYMNKFECIRLYQWHLDPSKRLATIHQR